MDTAVNHQSYDELSKDNDLIEKLDCKFVEQLQQHETNKYSSELKLWTIDIGCRNREECVRYSNFLCHWIEQKINQIKIYSFD